MRERKTRKRKQEKEGRNVINESRSKKVRLTVVRRSRRRERLCVCFGGPSECRKARDIPFETKPKRSQGYIQGDPIFPSCTYALLLLVVVYFHLSYIHLWIIIVDNEHVRTGCERGEFWVDCLKVRRRWYWRVIMVAWQ